jgi:hypothetical protein
MVAECHARGVVPLFVFMETVTEPQQPWRAEQRLEVLDLANRAGFRVLDLTGAYGTHKPEELWIRENDGHANALGNRLIGARLHELLLASNLVPTE